VKSRAKREIAIIVVAFLGQRYTQIDKKFIVIHLLAHSHTPITGSVMIGISRYARDFRKNYLNQFIPN
jgi:hypothetical protein